jgi:cytochrome P450
MAVENISSELISGDGSSPVAWNPLQPELVTDPYPIYQQLREADPVHLSPMGAWVLTRHADVSAVLRDPRFGRAGYQDLLLTILGPGPMQHSFSQWMLFVDPPDHTRLRTLVSQAFTPRVIEALRPHIQQLVDRLLDNVEDSHSMDLMAQLAYPLPVMVICEMLGVPDQDRDRFHDWSFALALALDIATVTPAIVEAGNAAAVGLTDYFHDLVRERRRAPREGDLLSGLIAAEEQGDRLTEDELLATCVLLFFAGHETTVNLIGNGVLALLQHPDECSRLRDDPGLIASAIEELLRFDGPVQRTGRVLTQDVSLGGKTLPAGARVVAVIGSANRDPARFPDPDRLNLSRADNRHLAFGAGLHYCLGASLARAEAQLAVNTLLRRLPVIGPNGTPEWRQSALLRGLRSFPVTW